MRSRSLPIAGGGAGVSAAAARLDDEVREIDRAARPIYAGWEVTLRCDLGCRHCGSRAGHARADELDTAEALDLVAQLAALGVREVTLIGGEAYLRPDWTTLIAAIDAAGMRATMTTGGRGLDRARARAAAAVGLAAASVSIDGVAATHDALRGARGSHRAGLAALAHLRDAGVPVAANTQINGANLGELAAVLDLIAAAGARAWQVQLTVPMGRAADRPALIVQPYEMLRVVPMLAELTAVARRRGVTLWPGNNVGTMGPHDRALRGHTAPGGTAACGAGRAIIGIEADGAIKGCPSLATRDFAGGTIRHHALRDLWQRSAPLRFNRGRSVDDLWGWCRTCAHAARCLAGCNWTASSTLGRTGNNPFCHHRALAHAAAEQREMLVPVRAAPGEPFDHGEHAIIVEEWPTAAQQAWLAEPHVPRGLS
jgi:radical SAM protein with 4Fe4S-binding SPASM domain